MRRSVIALLTLLLSAALLLVGCSGNSMTPGSSTAGQKGTGRVTFTVKWPTRSRLIPAAANCIVVRVTGPNGLSMHQEADRPAIGNTSALTFELPPHTLTAVATAYPQVGGSGAAQATGQTSFTPVVGKTTQVILTMGSTIDHLTVTPKNLDVTQGDTTPPFTATPYNAAGEVVLTATGNIGWSSSNQAVATVDSIRGIVTGVSRGKATITATEKESGKQDTATVYVMNLYIYVVDSANNRIVRMDNMSGDTWTTFGSQGSGTNQFNLPGGIAIGPDGKIYVTDGVNARIVRMDDMIGTNWISFGSYGINNDQHEFAGLAGITVGPDEKIYATDRILGSIVCMNDMTGAGWTTLSKDPNPTPMDIALGPDGKIYVADGVSASCIIRMDDITGSGWATFGSLGSGANQFDWPTGIAIGPDGKIYVADSDNNRIVRMDDMNGTNWTTFGSQGNGVDQFGKPSSGGQYSGPRNIAIAPDGKIYATDPGNNRIVRVDDMTGAGWTTLGNTGSGADQFNYPIGITVVSH